MASSSWFQDLAKTVKSSVSEATHVLESSVTDASTVLEKLTLTTPEMAAARKELEQAAKSKQARKDQLARLMPWETDDPECQILVAECKTAILELSKHKSTFFGPFRLTPQPKLTNSTSEEATDSVREDETPSDESQAILSQLHPIPKLLGDQFDMHMHVGLIEKLLKVDANLVQMQSQHSGGGPREVFFWKNYFIHVAHCRYTAGLGIDEIWGDHVVDVQHKHEEQEEEEVVEFTSAIATPGANLQEETPGGGTTESSGYEMVAEPTPPPVVEAEEDVKVEEIDVAEDYELDELEAEIARELEDD